MDENKKDVFEFMCIVSDVLDDCDNLVQMHMRKEKMLEIINTQYALKYNFRKDMFLEE